jgi:pyruvate kinase
VPEATPRDILDDVIGLRERVSTWGAATFRHWRPRIRNPDFAAGALNLAHYLAFRKHDLRSLQRALMPLGISSLGRSEGRVLASLDAVVSALSRLDGQRPRHVLRPPSRRQFYRGERRLERATDALFGPGLENRHGRILATLGSDAARDPDLLRRLAECGADGVRINCAHDDPDRWARMIENLRAAERATGRRIKILMDLAGPKVRTTEVATPADRERMVVGDHLLICRAGALRDPAYAFQTGCTLPIVLERLKVGDPVAVDDGKLRGRIVGEVGGNLLASIEQAPVKGVKLKPEKGLNFPGVKLGLDPLTAKDLADLDFVAAHADLVGYSFVESAQHVACLQEELARRRPDWQRLALVPKIETGRAVVNLPEIMVQAAGRQPLAVMIARGDLAVELGFERVAEMQEEILWLCEAAHVPVIWATEVLDGLVRKGMPSRGEMTDAAMAARAECIMLNKGPNQLAGIEVLDNLLRRMGEHQAKKTPLLRELHSWAV